MLQTLKSILNELLTMHLRQKNIANTFMNMLMEDARRHTNRDTHSVLYPITVCMKSGVRYRNMYVQRVDEENMLATLTKESGTEELPIAIHLSIFEIASIRYR